MRPVVSPRDGSVACWYTEDLPKPRWKIGIFPPEGGKPVRTFEFAPNVSVDSRLQWTPDGRSVGFVDSRGGSSNIWVQPVDGGPPRPLTNFPTGQIFSFAWSRDGQLVYSRGIQTSDVVMITEVH
jgi:Tol biopolymer transport system component